MYFKQNSWLFSGRNYSRWVGTVPDRVWIDISFWQSTNLIYKVTSFDRWKPSWYVQWLLQNRLVLPGLDAIPINPLICVWVAEPLRLHFVLHKGRIDSRFWSPDFQNFTPPVIFILSNKSLLLFLLAHQCLTPLLGFFFASKFLVTFMKRQKSSATNLITSSMSISNSAPKLLPSFAEISSVMSSSSLLKSIDWPSAPIGLPSAPKIGFPSAPRSSPLGPTRGLPSGPSKQPLGPVSGLPSAPRTQPLGPTSGLPSAPSSSPFGPTSGFPSGPRSSPFGPVSGLPSAPSSSPFGPSSGFPSGPSFAPFRGPSSATLDRAEPPGPIGWPFSPRIGLPSGPSRAPSETLPLNQILYLTWANSWSSVWGEKHFSIWSQQRLSIGTKKLSIWSEKWFTVWSEQFSIGSSCWSTIL